MVGLPRYAMSAIVVIQTLAHSTPGWAAGLALSALVLHYAFSVFSSLTGLHLDFGISPFAFFVSALYGLVVPLLVCAALVTGAMKASIVAGLQQRAFQSVALTITRASERLSTGMRCHVDPPHSFDRLGAHNCGRRRRPHRRHDAHAFPSLRRL